MSEAGDLIRNFPGDSPFICVDSDTLASLIEDAEGYSSTDLSGRVRDLLAAGRQT